MKVFYVHRELVGFNGTRLSHPVKAFSEESLAKDCVATLQQQMQAFLKANLVVNTPDGPRGVTDLSHFLAECGVAGMNFPYLIDDVHESNLVIPRAGVQLQ